MDRLANQVRLYAGPGAARAAAPIRHSGPRLRATSVQASPEVEASGYDIAILRLFFAWMFLQCFFYGALPFLRWDIGIGINLTPDKLVLVAMLLVMGARSLGSKSIATDPPTRASRALSMLSIAFTAIALMSWWVNGSDAGKANFGELTRVLNIAAFPALAYTMARHLRYTKAMLRQLAWFFALLGVYLSVTAVAEHFSIQALVFPGYILDPKVGIHFGRSRGPFVNTIGNGGMLLIAFLCWSFMAARLVGLKRLVAIFFTILTVPALYFTETRSVWLAFATILTTVIVFRTPMKRIAVAMMWVLAFAFALGVGSKFSMFDQTLFSRRQRTIDYRLDNYQIAWNAFRVHPVFGLGYGKFRIEWAQYADLRNSRLGVGLDDGNHNTVLGVLVELGILGAVPFVGMTICAAVIAIRTCRRLKGPRAAYERQIAVLALGAFETFVVLGLTSDLKTIPTVNITAFWFVGLISSVQSTWLVSLDQGSPIEPQPRFLPSKHV